MSREFTPADIRNIGQVTLPAIAASYETFETAIANAAAAVNNTFGDDTLIPHPAAELFLETWGNVQQVSQEVPDTMRAMGTTFVEIADGYDDDEADIVLDLETTVDEATDLDGLGNSYKDALDNVKDGE